MIKPKMKKAYKMALAFCGAGLILLSLINKDMYWLVLGGIYCVILTTTIDK